MAWLDRNLRSSSQSCMRATVLPIDTPHGCCTIQARTALRKLHHTQSAPLHSLSPHPSHSSRLSSNNCVSSVSHHGSISCVHDSGPGLPGGGRVLHGRGGGSRIRAAERGGEDLAVQQVRQRRAPGGRVGRRAGLQEGIGGRAGPPGGEAGGAQRAQGAAVRVRQERQATQLECHRDDRPGPAGQAPERHRGAGAGRGGGDRGGRGGQGYQALLRRRAARQAHHQALNNLIAHASGLTTSSKWPMCVPLSS